MTCACERYVNSVKIAATLSHPDFVVAGWAALDCRAGAIMADPASVAAPRRNCRRVVSSGDCEFRTLGDNEWCTVEFPSCCDHWLAPTGSSCTQRVRTGSPVERS